MWRRWRTFVLIIQRCFCVLCFDWLVRVFQKLKAIEELKDQQANGKVLQKNQVTRFTSAWAASLVNNQSEVMRCVFVVIMLCLFSAGENPEGGSAAEGAGGAADHTVDYMPYLLSHGAGLCAVRGHWHAPHTLTVWTVPVLFACLLPLIIETAGRSCMCSNRISVCMFCYDDAEAFASYLFRIKAADCYFGFEWNLRSLSLW